MMIWYYIACTKTERTHFSRISYVTKEFRVLWENEYLLTLCWLIYLTYWHYTVASKIDPLTGITFSNFRAELPRHNGGNNVKTNTAFGLCFCFLSKNHKLGFVIWKSGILESDQRTQN